MPKPKPKTDPRLSSLAEPLAVFLKYRHLAVEADEWPASAANDNFLPPSHSSEDLAGMRVESRSDARPSLKYLEDLGPGDGKSGPWNLGKLKVHRGATHAKGEALNGEIEAYRDGSGNWRKPSDGFGGAKSGASSTLPERQEAEGVREVATDEFVTHGSNGAADREKPFKFDWSLRHTTSEQRTAWRELLRRFQCDGTIALEDAGSANGLTPKRFQPGERPKRFPYPGRSPQLDDEPECVERQGQARVLISIRSASDARAELAQLHGLIGNDNTKAVRALASAGALSDIGVLSHADATRQWAAILGKRRLLKAAGAIEAAFEKLRKKNLRSAA